MTIYDFFYAILSKLKGKKVENTNMLPVEEIAKDSEVQCITSSNEEDVQEKTEEQVNVVKRTLMTKLYTLEQEIAIFESDFPSEYQSFLQRIENLRSVYTSTLEELKKSLTFEIDPECDTSKIDEVIRLEKDIKKFIESTVRFHIISKRLQRLIKKLNILYNVSISHSKECEKEKVRLQLESAIQSEKKLAEEFKMCDYILSDKQLKERIIELLSYADYEIFKTYLRNSKQAPETLIGKLVMLEEFNKFDYVTTFVAYLKDELSDLLELLPLVSSAEYRKLLKEKAERLQIRFTYSTNFSEVLCSVEFWNDFFGFESTLLEMLKGNGVSKEIATVKLIDKMDIKVEENDVLVSPITNANLALVNIFSMTQNKCVLLMIKLLESLSKDITYREIYFLLLLFDALEVIKNTPNDLIGHLEKYVVKYPYNRRTIMEKKEQVLNASNKEYVIIFHLDDISDEIIATLRSLEMDFKVENGNVLINSFYFNGLEHVLSNLQTNTNNSWITEV